MKNGAGRSIRSRFRPAPLALAVVMGAMLVAPMSIASAADPTGAQYKPANARVSQFGGENGGGAGSSGLSSQVGGLPFTGIDVIVLAIAAVALVTGGLVLRRVASSSDRT